MLNCALIILLLRVRQVKVLAARPEDLSLTPRTHMAENENQLGHVVLW